MIQIEKMAVWGFVLFGLFNHSIL